MGIVRAHMAPTLGLLHTTETDDGTGAVLSRNMPKAGTEPHAIYQPTDDREWVLHAPHETAKALRNEAGGVETNRRERDGKPGNDVYQVEIVARASEVAAKSDEWYGNLRRYLQRKSRELGIPYVFPLPFAHDYGHARSVRLSHAAWYDPNLTGWIGHCHVPENTHWDPGPLDLARLAPGASLPVSQEDDDMTMSIITPEAGHPNSGQLWVAQGLLRAHVPTPDALGVLIFLGAETDANGNARVLPHWWFDLMQPVSGPGTFAPVLNTVNGLHQIENGYRADVETRISQRIGESRVQTLDAVSTQFASLAASIGTPTTTAPDATEALAKIAELAAGLQALAASLA